MKLRNAIVVVSIALLSFVGGCGRTDDPALTTVDGHPITRSDFASRYEKYLLATSERDNIVVRKKILENMIHETLIYQDATAQGFDSDEIYSKRMEDIRSQALLDGYSRLLTTDSMSVSEGELWQEFRAMNTKVSARYVYAKTEEEARVLKLRLDNGDSFHRVAREVFDDPDLASSGGNLGFFGWDEMEPSLQQAAFVMPVGTISDPIRLKVGYGILKVEKRVERPLVSEVDYATAKPKLEKAVRERKVVRYLRNAVDEIEKGLAFEFNEEVLHELFSNWNDIARRDGSSQSTERASILADKSTLPLVKTKHGVWNLSTFLEKLQKTRQKHLNKVQRVEDLRQVVKGLAVREVMLEKSVEAGLEEDRRVIQQIATVREDFLLRRWKSSIEDTLGLSGWDEIQLRAEYLKNGDSFTTLPEANVAEILVRKKDLADRLMADLRKGARFSDLARKHSIRTWAAKNGGELGFASKAEYGPAAEKIFGARGGQIVGPIQVNGFFGIYKVLAVKTAQKRSFSEARADIIKALLPAKQRRAFETTLESLRTNAKIETDFSALANIVVASQ